MDKPIILYDGYCKLCEASIRFVIKRDRKNSFKYVPIQSEEGNVLLSKYGLSKQKNKSVIYIENKIYYQKSTAALKILIKVSKHPFFPRLLFIFPKLLRDFVYSIIAKNRSRWFGVRDDCYLP